MTYEWKPETHRSDPDREILSVDGCPVFWHAEGVPLSVSGPHRWRHGELGMAYYPADGVGYTAMTLTSHVDHFRASGYATLDEAQRAAERAWEGADPEYRRWYAAELAGEGSRRTRCPVTPPASSCGRRRSG